MKEKYESENSHFHDPAKIKQQRPVEKPKDAKQSPWDFRCPQYDQRSSCFVNAGTHYGVAKNQPVGHKNNPKAHDQCLPYGRVETMRVDEVG